MNPLKRLPRNLRCSGKEEKHQEQTEMQTIKDSDIFGYSRVGDKLDVKKQTLIYNLKTPKHYNKLDLVAYVIDSVAMYNRDSILPLLESAKFPSLLEDRCFGAFYGLAIGDALGVPLEFEPVCYKQKLYVSKMQPTIRNSLKPGQWTDDTSQALCLADSLIMRSRFDPLDFNLRLLAWWYGGYNNAFRKDSERKSKKSVGLGGNTALAMTRFLDHGESFTKAGDSNTSGNGSIMRLSPLAVWFANFCTSRGTFNRDIITAMRVAKHSSLATHQGVEAGECCALLMMFLVRAIQTGDKFLVFEELATFFKSTNSPTVECIAKSQAEYLPATKEIDPDRNWNWKAKEFKYSSRRTQENPNYIGSYACDALAMAFHCIYTTDSFRSALLKAVNLRGDADSVGAITGQMAGALYGYSSIPSDWLRELFTWDDAGIGIRTSLLINEAQKYRTRSLQKEKKKKSTTRGVKHS